MFWNILFVSVALDVLTESNNPDGMDVMLVPLNVPVNILCASVILVIFRLANNVDGMDVRFVQP